MKRKLPWLIFVVSTAVLGATPDAGPYPPQLKSSPQQAQAAHLAAELLTRYHYKAIPLNNALSERIFDQYLKALDPERIFFVQPDIDQLSADRAKLGEAMLKEDLTVPFGNFNLFERRATERFG